MKSLEAAGVPDDEIDAITHQNAMRHFRFDPFATRSREDCTVGALRARATDVDITPRSVGKRAQMTKASDLLERGPAPLIGVPDRDLLARVYDTLQGYYELGCEVRDEPLARFVRNLDTPHIYDANFAAFVRAGTRNEISSVLDRADELYDGLPHRVFHIDPWTPPAFEAQLLLDGFAFEDELQLLLEGPLSTSVRAPADRRAARGVGRGLVDPPAADSPRPRGAGAPGGASPLGGGGDLEMVATKRLKAPALRFWLAAPTTPTARSCPHGRARTASARWRTCSRTPTSATGALPAH